MIKNLFEIYRNDAHIIIKLFGIKMKFKSFIINQISDICYIPSYKKLKKNGTIFKHPIGIVINKDAKIGKNCTIYQNVTIGRGKYNPINKSDTPILSDNITIYPNSVIIGGIKIGANTIIGAGSIVTKDFPENVVIAGNPAKIINKISKNIN